MCSLTGGLGSELLAEAGRVWGTTSYSPRERLNDQTERGWSITESSLIDNRPKVKESLLKARLPNPKEGTQKAGQVQAS